MDNPKGLPCLNTFNGEVGWSSYSGCPCIITFKNVLETKDDLKSHEERWIDFISKTRPVTDTALDRENINSDWYCQVGVKLMPSMQS